MRSMAGRLQNFVGLVLDPRNRASSTMATNYIKVKKIKEIKTLGKVKIFFFAYDMVVLLESLRYY